MSSRQPLKDVLTRIVDDLNIMTKQLVCIMCVPRDQRSIAAKDVDVAKLVELIKLKEQELTEGLKIASKQAERQKVIDELKEEVKKRDEAIAKIFACFKESEDVLINAIFQANRKLKSIREANRKKVQPMELIKYAHRISASNSVAAPLTWQQGDPQRPYPVEMEMWQGWPERSKDRNKNVMMMEKEFVVGGGGVMTPVGLGQMSSSGAVLPPGMMFPAGSGLGQPTTPIQQQQEFFIRPQQSSGIFPPPPPQIPSSPIAGLRSQGGWVSPRAPGHIQGSPRSMQQRPSTPMMASNVSTAVHGLSSQQTTARSPFASSGGGQHIMQQQNVNVSTTIQHQTAAVVKIEASSNPNIPPNSVEVLSSDSSSSSDSDSQ